jgi:hypothetical protein
MKNKNKLRHCTIVKGVEPISPSKKFIPDWYKNGENIVGGNIKKVTRLPINPGFQLCGPFVDSLTSGYMMPLICDIAVEQSENGPIISWNYDDFKIITKRKNDTNTTLPVPSGYSDQHFAWHTQHFYKIPKGYSALVTHPLNRFDLPFQTLSGIVDGEFAVYDGQLPVFFNSTFEGIIPAGTPIAQIILFKTENWQSELDYNLLEEANINHVKGMMPAFGWYKKNIRKRKSYD